MNIPPFPSQDLAKLVLGYLAEEQLMTAYDEFLQASPYLNAFGNEYDRIFMTSLKNILAEYRAVKIYVEMCKPIALRRKLFQCSNLHEVVKFLIQHVDISKILQEPTQSKCSVEKQTSSANINTCEVCKSLKLESCSCNNKSSHIYSGQIDDHYSGSVLDSSVEDTPLSDLIGNRVTTKKIVSDNNTIDLDSHAAFSPRLVTSNVVSEKSTLNNSTSTNTKNKESQKNVSPVDDTLVKNTDPHQIKQKDELQHISNQVCHNNQSGSSSDVNNPKSIGGYHNFATGVNGESRTIIVPDSSTSEKVYIQVPVSADNSVTSNLAIFNKMKQTRTQYLLKVAHVNNTLKPNELVSISTTTNNCSVPTIKPKTDENKVKILSDVKVDSSFNNNEGTMKMPQVLKNATSTPLLQMQTIVINGTPVYRQEPIVDKKLNYTKDEIMAMPTIILAPVPGPPHRTLTQTENHSTNTNKTTAARSLCSLTIDVDHPEQINKDSNKTTEIDKKAIEKETRDDTIPKTTDITCASAPKDNTVTGTTETSTPQILPPKRKSSSTPRRSSHVRVLDFTTPRRILHETANQFVAKGNNEPIVVSKKSLEVSNSFQTDTNLKNADKCTGSELSKENEIKSRAVCPKASNWDADLRVLAVIPELSVEVTTPKPKSTKKKKRSKTSLVKDDNKQSTDKRIVKKRANKDKSTKKYIPEPIADIDISTNKVPAKPTINIITVTDVTTTNWTATEKSQTVKSNDEKVNTPEMEKMSLQNEIGAKLNISDFLETPYKQALYDIQMETPRFMAPDIPGDPLSDIKIMNIPTPKFLNAQTPSSYSSRPTDYSSGGSYYKPDDQDYLRVTDDLLCPVTSSVSKENKGSDVSNNREVDSSENNHKKNDKPCRPVRQCRKNVSYYSNSNSNIKPKEVDNNIDSSFSDVTDTSFCEANTEKEAKNKEKSTPKNRSNMKMPTKYRRSPLKKEVSKSFMKIRPRRPTPTKKDNAKRKKKTPESSKVQGRKKITKQQEENVSTPVIASAPTKSRRKSSTPRKLHCTKSFNSKTDGHDSPELLAKPKENVAESNVISTHDSDTEQLPLRWSDDGSQDVKSKTESNPVNESEDIKKIQEYLNNATNSNELKEGCLHIDLVKRGFDLETAKIIERELLDTSPHTTTDFAINNVVTPETKTEIIECVTESKSDNIVLEKALESDCSISNNLQIVQQDEEEDDDVIELSVHECNEDTPNFYLFNHDDITNTPRKELVKLKDKFSMEVCLDDDLSIRLRVTPFNLLLDQEPDVALLGFDEQETEMAVRSISNMGKLFTPVKESIKAQCYEIFDSTLTSLDTPLKARSPKFREEVTVTEIVLEVENIDVKEKVETKKRKRAQSSNLSEESESKKAKPEAQYLLNSANIQNIDIESVLSKLHGP
ncbi:unnamed protein product [Diatraea saccharalis]|uniref:Uncharacterized protein n=1 Tax=Diatraea saccharalis TaxID=40085 RepID=A0A9P0C806_9NEOP|nr:unnamed protein product [Diatraea saccharalis]